MGLCWLGCQRVQMAGRSKTIALAPSVTVVATEGGTEGAFVDGAVGSVFVGVKVGAGAHAVSQTATTARRRWRRNTRIITAETLHPHQELQHSHEKRLDSIP